MVHHVNKVINHLSLYMYTMYMYSVYRIFWSISCTQVSVAPNYIYIYHIEILIIVHG